MEKENKENEERLYTGTIYFIESVETECVRIGYTTNLESRFKTLKRNACTLKVLYSIPGSFALEREIHKHLKEHKKIGDWFYKNKDIIEFVDFIKNNNDIWVNFKNKVEQDELDKIKSKKISKEIHEWGVNYVVIPGEVAFNPDLTYADMMVWWLIHLLDGKNNCFASNEYLAYKLKKTTQSISNSIARLKSLEYIDQISFNPKTGVRILKVNKDCFEKYSHLIHEFNSAPYNFSYRGSINKVIIDNKENNKSNNLSFSKEKEKETDVSSTPDSEDNFIPRFIDRKKLKKALYYSPNIDTRAEKIILYWNSKGKPLTVHAIKNSKVIKRINKLIKNKLRTYKMKDFIEAIDTYYEFITSPLVTVTKIVSLDNFIEPDEYQRDAIYNAKKNIQIESWFYECLKGRDYLFNTYGKFVKDKYPEVTDRIKSTWKDRIGKINGDATYSENNFRRAANETVVFINSNKRKFLMDRRELIPDRFVKYVFDAVFSGKNLNKVSPSWLAKDFVYENILPKYLINNGYMK